jgi:hypothetical protein
MKRRDFISLLGCIAASLPYSVASETKKPNLGDWLNCRRGSGPRVRRQGQFAANRGVEQPPHTQGHDQSATLPLLAST